MNKTDRTTVKVPLGRGSVEASIPNLLGVIEPAYVPGVDDMRQEIRRAIRSPIGSARLCEIAKGKKSVAIVVNDITRPYPGGLMVEELADELKLAGITDEQIFLVVAYGTHREQTRDELIEMFGSSVVERFRFVHHHAEAPETLKDFGMTDGGLPIIVNREFAQADVKVLTGLIALHHAAGFSGGRKSVLPGVSSMESIKIHHSYPISPAQPSMGWLEGNPFHEMALQAAKKIGIDFIVNTVDNADRQMVRVVAGDLEKAHLAGCRICEDIWITKIREKADVVIVSPGGFPRDINLWQAQKACAVGELACKEGGHIIVVAEAPDGAPRFADILKNAESPKACVDSYFAAKVQGAVFGKAYMWSRAMTKFKVSIVNSKMSKEELESMFFSSYPTLQEAVDDSIRTYGENASFLVIPYAAECSVKLIND